MSRTPPTNGFQNRPQDINRSGRPADAKEWREKCRKWAMQDGGLEILIGIAEGKGLAADQLKAVEFLIDHGMGKAVTQVAGADDTEFSKLKLIISRDETKTDGSN